MNGEHAESAQSPRTAPIHQSSLHAYLYALPFSEHPLIGVRKLPFERPRGRLPCPDARCKSSLEAGRSDTAAHLLMASILDVRDLRVAYHSPSGGETIALDGVSFSIGEGEILGVLGESGSGKSSLAASLLCLLPANGRILSGSVLYEGKDLLSAGDDDLAAIRSGRISLIFQEPGLALHPAIRVGDQISEVVRAHGTLSPRDRRAKVEGALAAVFPSDASWISPRYPHELSGGQRQRVLIAQAIVCRPAVLVADEPTASLDPATQAEIIALFRELRRTLGLALVFITHNPALLAGFADRILTLYAGKVAEYGASAEVLSHPMHPYTEALLRCLPAWPPSPAVPAKLPMIAGDPPNMNSLPAGCRFEPRCPARMEACGVREPAPTALGAAHTVSCFKFGG